MSSSSERGGGPDVAPAGQARLLASSSLVQQIAQASGLVVLLVVITVLARRLSLSQLGAYGLVAPLSGYLLVLRNSVASSTVRAMSAGADDAERARVFSTAAALYAAVGLATGLAIAAIGAVIALSVLHGDLQRTGVLGALMLGAVTGAGLISTVFLDALRSSMLLTRAASLEIVGVALQLALMLALILVIEAPLWTIIGASGAIPLMSGTLSALAVRRLRLPYRFRRGEVNRVSAGQLVPTAGYLLVMELANLVIYSLDRVILGVFKTPATVGLYEGPIRTHNLFYAVNGALAVTTLPATSRYTAQRDSDRLRALILRGSRYTLAFVVPLAVTAIALARPLLEVWLGRRFGEGALALSILVSYWLLYGALAVTPGFLVGAGKAGTVARYMVAVAGTNLVLSLALTPLLGLEGPALGTAIPYAVAFPFLLRLALTAAPVRLGELARTAWLPAYSLGAVLAAALVVARVTIHIDTLPELLIVGGGGVLAYWLAFYALWLAPEERRLVRDTFTAARPHGRR